jgi:hypothetical protein
VDLSKTPHVCFKAEFPPAAKADDELPRLLERQLQSRVDSVRVVKSRLLAPWAAVLQTGEKSFSVVLGRSKYAADEWILIVSPPDTPSLLNRLRGRTPPSDASELMATCRKIHAVLTVVPNISAVRWYFEGFNNQTTAVATPDELPWAGP